MDLVFTMTEPCLCSSNQGIQDGFIAKINSDGSMLLRRQSEFSTYSIDLITSISMEPRKNLVRGEYSGRLFSSSLPGYGDIIAEIGCDPGYINFEAQCESTTFSLTFDPTYHPSQTIIYF